MKQALLIVFLLTAACSVFAQKEDLKKLSSDYEQLFVSDKTFHLTYNLTIASKIDTTIERMDFDLYKSKDKDYLKMGETQVVIHDGTLQLVVNNQIRTIRFSDDSSNLSSKNALVSDFISIIDSSSAVTFSSKDNKLSYRLSFSDTYGYESVDLVFSKKTKHLVKIYAVFEKDYPAEFKSIEVNYAEPDFKWIPDANFPDAQKYITKSNGRYVIQDAYDSYKVY